MPLMRAGFMIWNPSACKCAPNVHNETDNARFLLDQDLSATEIRQWRRNWGRPSQGRHGACYPSGAEKETICGKRVPIDKYQKSFLQPLCLAGFATEMGCRRKMQSKDIHRIGACVSQAHVRSSRVSPFRQGHNFQAQVPALQCRVEFGAIHPKLLGIVAHPLGGQLVNVSGKNSLSQSSLRAVTDGREALKDEGQEASREQIDVVEKTQERTVRSGGKLFESYATTTAIAIQDSLPPEGFVVLVSCAVGLLTGVCVVLFNLGVQEIHDFAWAGIPNTGAAWLRYEPLETHWQQIVLVPAGGGVVVGLVNTLRTALDGPKEGNSFWGYAKMFLRSLLKTGAAVITLGTGSSLGPEGPSVEIGASIAKGVTTVLRSSRQRKLSLVAAGSAAGISSGFNAAVAGCFFAVESVLPGLSSADSAPSLTTAMVLLSSVLASVVSQAGLGSDPAFRIPAYDFRSPTELPLYLLLGVLCGGVSVALVKGSAYATTLFEKLQKTTRLPAGFLPPIGGLCVGVIAVVYPEVLYWGFENVDVLLESHLPWAQGPPAMLLLQLVGAKLVATSLCRGSGLVGGVYAPSLFIGAALGSAYGSLASYAAVNADPIWHLDVLQVAAPQAYALVGMAATLAGVCQVPLTSVLLLFELTRDYRIILPLMGAVGLSSWVASTLQRTKSAPVVQLETPFAPGDAVSVTRLRGAQGSQPLDGVLIINSKQPVSQPVALKSGGSVSGDNDICSLEDSLCLTNFEVGEDRLTDQILVMSAMRTRYLALGGEAHVGEAMGRMLAEREWCVVVVNQEKGLEGLLTLSDVQQEAEKWRSRGRLEELQMRPISSLCRSVSAAGEVQVVTVFPDMTLKAAQRLMAGRGLRQLPVVAHSQDPQGKTGERLVLGLLDREGIKLACRAEATRRVLCFSVPLNAQSLPDGTNGRQ